LIGYYLPDIQLSQRGRIEKISIKVAGGVSSAFTWNAPWGNLSIEKC
jgi:hypothetical protein